MLKYQNPADQTKDDNLLFFIRHNVRIINIGLRPHTMPTPWPMPMPWPMPYDMPYVVGRAFDQYYKHCRHALFPFICVFSPALGCCSFHTLYI